MLIYDNGGATVDRYTIILGKPYNSSLITMSEKPLSPNGVNMYSHDVDGEYIPQPNEKEIALEDCPVEVLVAIIKRIEQY